MSIYLGETPIANTGYDKANTDLSNLTNTGKNIANWSNNVTNCITEIPQDIKLELNNGTLTLKAGSKVYVPNGVDVFDAVTIASDKTPVYGSAATRLFMVIQVSNQNVFFIKQEYITSGTTAPTVGDNNRHLWYDTTNNIVKMYAPNSSDYIQTSFPICICTSSGTDNKFSSIDQIFNGFGYIGSTVFALPGVKGLIPDGRNADGTLKNIEFTIDSVKTATRTWVRIVGEDQFIAWFPGHTSGGFWYYNRFFVSNTKPAVNLHSFWYNPALNILSFNDTGTDYEKCNALVPLFYCGSDGTTKINDIYDVKQVFHTLDYNDSSTISGWSMPSSRYIDLTFGATGTTYTAPTNGWFLLYANSTSTSVWAQFVNLSKSDFVVRYSNNASVDFGLILPVNKGDVVLLQYQSIALSQPYAKFRFYYGEGENV